MVGRSTGVAKSIKSRIEENVVGWALQNMVPSMNLMPTQLTWEEPPKGYVPIDLHESPFLVPPHQGTDFPDPSDYGLTPNFASFEIEEIGISECHICVTFSYAIGFIQFPSSTVCFIAPECRRPEQHPEIPLTCTTDKEVSWEELETSNTTEGIPVLCPPDEPPPGERFGEPGEFLIFEQWTYESSSTKSRGRVNQEPWENRDDFNPPARLIARRSFPAPVVVAYRADSGLQDNSYSVVNDWNPNQINRTRVNSYSRGAYAANIPWTWNFTRSTSVRSYVYTFGSVGFNTFRETESNSVSRGSSVSWTVVKKQDGQQLWPRPSEPEPSPKQYMPRCCENPTIERLLRKLVKAVGDPRKITVPVYDKTENRNVSSLADAVERWSHHQSSSTADLYKVIEPRAFDGASYPMRLTHAGAKGDKPIRNYLQAWEAILRQIDTAVGLLPFKLKVEDTNAAQQGNQSIEIQVHSISDALKLLVENIVDIEGDGDATNNLLVRMGLMLVQQHQALAKIESTTRNTEEYLDYKVKQKVQKVPSTLNPILPQNGQGFGNAQNLDRNTEGETEWLMSQLLRNTELRVKVTEIDEKRLLSEKLYSIEKFAANASAGNTVHYEGKKTLEKLLEGALDNDELKEFLERKNIRKALQGESLSSFIADAEKGYPSAEGLRENSPDNPYGRPKRKAPNIRKGNRRRR